MQSRLRRHLDWDWMSMQSSRRASNDASSSASTAPGDGLAVGSSAPSSVPSSSSGSSRGSSLDLRRVSSTGGSSGANGLQSASSASVPSLAEEDQELFRQVLMRLVPQELIQNNATFSTLVDHVHRQFQDSHELEWNLRNCLKEVLAEKASEPDLMLRCPNGHLLERFETDTDGFECNLCDGEQARSSVLLGCEDCDYDLCHDCALVTAHDALCRTAEEAKFFRCREGHKMEPWRNDDTGAMMALPMDVECAGCGQVQACKQWLIGCRTCEYDLCLSCGGNAISQDVRVLLKLRLPELQRRVLGKMGLCPRDGGLFSDVRDKGRLVALLISRGSPAEVNTSASAVVDAAPLRTSLQLYLSSNGCSLLRSSGVAVAVPSSRDSKGDQKVFEAFDTDKQLLQCSSALEELGPVELQAELESMGFEVPIHSLTPHDFLSQLVINAKCRVQAAALYEMDQQHALHKKEQGSSASTSSRISSSAPASSVSASSVPAPLVPAMRASATSAASSSELQGADREPFASFTEEQLACKHLASVAVKEEDSTPMPSFTEGQRACTQRTIVMRKEEAFESEQIKLVEKDSMIEVLKKGQGVRVFVRDESGQEGWVSVVARDGSELLALPQASSSSSGSTSSKLIEGNEVALTASSVECLCCFEEHACKDTVRCPAGHSFCAGCVNQYVANAAEAGCHDFRCIATKDCDQAFTPDVLSAVVPDKVWELIQKRSLRRSIASSGAKAGRSDHMRACPFCEFIAVVDDGATSFRCSQCRRESCLTCLEEVHPGLTCQEVKIRLHRRKTTNERLSEAIIRTCPWCQKVGVHTRFLLSDGCNKVTCPTCSQNSCYICGLEISHEVGYMHFCQHPLMPGEDCRECTKCRLFCDPEEADRIRMQRATECVEAGEEGFQICGSWDSWQLVDMKKEELDEKGGSSSSIDGEMRFTHIFRLSRRNWEKFQIIRNGNWEQRLHPRVPCSGPDGQVIFSTDFLSGHGKDWLIDARSEFTDRPQDAGKLGEFYRICLAVRGFWLRVSWERLQSLPEGERSSAMLKSCEAPELQPPLSVRDLHESPHSFWLVGSWSGWYHQEMKQTQGSNVSLQFECTIELPANHEGSFQILRNGEWDQRIYPIEAGGQADTVHGSTACGPDANGHGKNWDITATNWKRCILIKFYLFSRRHKKVFWVETRKDHELERPRRAHEVH